MQDALAFAFAVGAAGALTVLLLSPGFARLRPVMGGHRHANLALWAVVAAAMTLGAAMSVPNP